jgi:hypothetical protein
MAAVGTRKLTLTIDGDEVTPEVSKAEILAEETDSDFVSFADAAAGGGRTYKLALTFTQNLAAASLWDKVWAESGTEVPVLVRPYGNATATAGEPHFSGTVVVTEPDGTILGGEADASSTARWVTEVEWVFTAKPTRVVA